MCGYFCSGCGMCRSGQTGNSVTPGLCKHCDNMNPPFVAVCRTCGVRLDKPLWSDEEVSPGILSGQITSLSS